MSAGDRRLLQQATAGNTPAESVVLGQGRGEAVPARDEVVADRGGGHAAGCRARQTRLHRRKTGDRVPRDGDVPVPIF